MAIMRVCITRNAEAETNAGILRIVDAIMDNGENHYLLTRNRFSKGIGRILQKPFFLKNYSITNYEIQLPSKMGRGLKNISQLIIFQFLVIQWFIFNKDKYDIIHAFDLDTGLPALIASFLLKKPYVYHIADFYVDSRSGIPKFIRPFIRNLEYLVISYAETTIICNEERVDQIRGSKPKRLEIIHNSPIKYFDNSNTISTLKTPKSNETLVLGYVGGLSEKRFIRSAINVISRNSKFKLNIAGKGSLSNFVKQSAEELANVNYFGRINYSDALKLYSECDIMFAIYDPTVPNHRYSAPNKVYEAMMLGKLIIVAKGTGVDKLVEKENIGVAINYSEKEFEKVLNYILDNPDYAHKIGERSRETFKKYSWEKMKQKVIKIYRELETRPSL